MKALTILISFWLTFAHSLAISGEAEERLERHQRALEATLGKILKSLQEAKIPVKKVTLAQVTVTVDGRVSSHLGHFELTYDHLKPRTVTFPLIVRNGPLNPAAIELNLTDKILRQHLFGFFLDGNYSSPSSLLKEFDATLEERSKEIKAANKTDTSRAKYVHALKVQQLARLNLLLKQLPTVKLAQLGIDPSALEIGALPAELKAALEILNTHKDGVRGPTGPNSTESYKIELALLRGQITEVEYRTAKEALHLEQSKVEAALKQIVALQKLLPLYSATGEPNSEAQKQYINELDASGKVARGHLKSVLMAHEALSGEARARAAAAYASSMISIVEVISFFEQSGLRHSKTFSLVSVGSVINQLDVEIARLRSEAEVRSEQIDAVYERLGKSHLAVGIMLHNYEIELKQLERVRGDGSASAREVVVLEEVRILKLQFSEFQRLKIEATKIKPR